MKSEGKYQGTLPCKNENVSGGDLSSCSQYVVVALCYGKFNASATYDENIKPDTKTYLMITNPFSAN